QPANRRRAGNVARVSQAALCRGGRTGADAMNLRRRLGRTACLVIVAALFACVEIADRGKDVATLPKQLRTRQVVVTLAKAHSEQVQATAHALAQRYRLLEAGSFPLESIAVQCIVFDVPPERTLDEVVNELSADARVESVQLNKM